MKRGNYSGVCAFNAPGAIEMKRVGRRLSPGAAPVPIYAYPTPAKRWTAKHGKLKEVSPDGSPMPEVRPVAGPGTPDVPAPSGS